LSCPNSPSRFVSVAGAVVVFLLVFVVPRFALVLESSGHDVPMSSQADGAGTLAAPKSKSALEASSCMSDAAADVSAATVDAVRTVMSRMPFCSFVFFCFRLAR
jgi:hypothetical protein